VLSCAVFTAIGIDTDGRREIIGVNVSLTRISHIKVAHLILI
jgi:transposase-like protein